MSTPSKYGGRIPPKVQVVTAGGVKGGAKAPSLPPFRNVRKSSNEDADRNRLSSSSRDSARADGPPRGALASKMHRRQLLKQSATKSSKNLKNTASAPTPSAPPPPKPVVLTSGGIGGSAPGTKQMYADPLLSSPNSTFDPVDPPSSDVGDAGADPGRERPASSPMSEMETAGVGTQQTSLKDGAGSDRPDPDPSATGDRPPVSDIFWLFCCFAGIVVSFVAYGLMMEYATSGGRKLHELSFLFVTSSFYTLSGATGRYIRAEKPSDIPPYHFAVLGFTSMGSTFFSVRSLRYVIYPIQVLAKSCKPIPVMFMGALMGKRYPTRKYFNVFLIVIGVVMFMSGGENKKSSAADESSALSVGTQLIGIGCLFISLCFDGGTGAYEDKLMSVNEVKPFDLMYNIQLGKTILAGMGLIIFNQIHIFMQMVQDMGILLVGLGLTGAMGQIFIFITIAKFGALTTSIIGLSRKILTLVASIYFYGHSLNSIQALGLAVAVGAMVYDFIGKAGKKKEGHGHGHGSHGRVEKKVQQFEANESDDSDDRASLLQRSGGDIELAGTPVTTRM